MKLRQYTKKIRHYTQKGLTLLLTALLLFGAIGISLPSAPSAQAAPGEAEHFTLTGDAAFAQDRVLVKLAPSRLRISSSGLPNLGVAVAQSHLLNPSYGGLSVRSAQDQNNIYVLTLEDTGKEAVENALTILNANPAVELAEPDYLYELYGTPNDPWYSNQYALTKIAAPVAWDKVTWSKSVVVGIIDTGIQGDHPDLVNNLWQNPNPNQGGYTNDINGYSFTLDTETGKGTGGEPFDLNGHGTHVAGIIGAEGNNGVGVTGVNWKVSLAWLGAGTQDNKISTSAAIEAVNYAQTHNIKILNNSYGGSGRSELFEETVRKYSGLFVAAAGNDGKSNDASPEYPANFNCANVISVANSDSADQLYTESNFGKNSVDIAAPGTSILSTYKGSQYGYMTGTSMASPYVAGVAALIKLNNPDYSTAKIKAALLRGVDVLPELANKVNTSGRLNALNALTQDARDFVWFADSNLKQAVVDALKSIDSQTYGRYTVSSYIYSTDAVKITGLDASKKNITSMAGLQYLTNLEMLDCSDNSLTALDVSQNTLLKTLNCSNNRITTLELINNPELTSLACGNNKLTELSVSGSPGLEYLSTVQNPLNRVNAVLFDQDSQSPSRLFLTANGPGYVNAMWDSLNSAECYAEASPAKDAVFKLWVDGTWNEFSIDAKIPLTAGMDYELTANFEKAPAPSPEQPTPSQEQPSPEQPVQPSPEQPVQPSPSPGQPLPTPVPTPETATPAPTPYKQGWHRQTGGKWQYYDASGNIVTGWKSIENKWYYFGADATMHTGWLNQGGAWYYLNPGGDMAAGWQQVNGVWHEFASSGKWIGERKTKTGWKKYPRGWCFQTSGKWATGWVFINGTWYWFDSGAYMYTGWLQQGGAWYYMKSSGAMAKGWVQSGKAWYYMHPTGKMAAGWVKDGEDWYYMDRNTGAMHTGWLKLGADWYYMKPGGVMAANETLRIAGKQYSFNADGLWID